MVCLGDATFPLPRCFEPLICKTTLAVVDTRLRAGRKCIYTACESPAQSKPVMSNAELSQPEPARTERPVCRLTALALRARVNDAYVFSSLHVVLSLCACLRCGLPSDAMVTATPAHYARPAMASALGIPRHVFSIPARRPSDAPIPDAAVRIAFASVAGRTPRPSRRCPAPGTLHIPPQLQQCPSPTPRSSPPRPPLLRLLLTDVPFWCFSLSFTRGPPLETPFAL